MNLNRWPFDAQVEIMVGTMQALSLQSQKFLLNKQIRPNQQTLT